MCDVKYRKDQYTFVLHQVAHNKSLLAISDSAITERSLRIV